MIFKDRIDAGKKLAQVLSKYKNDPNAIALGLARGGVVVAAAVAEGLNIPLDVVVVRKVGAPDNEELAIGAVADEGKGIFNNEIIALLGVSKEYLNSEIERQREQVKKRMQMYSQGRKPALIKGKTAIIIDDGIATGASMKVAIESVRAKHPAKIVLAVPVAPPESIEDISRVVDEVVCLSTPAIFHAVGAFYEHFDQTSDADIKELLAKINP